MEAYPKEPVLRYEKHVKLMMNVKILWEQISCECSHTVQVVIIRSDGKWFMVRCYAMVTSVKVCDDEKSLSSFDASMVVMLCYDEQSAHDARFTCGVWAHAQTYNEG